MAPTATPLIAALENACADLAATGIRYALVGGLAVSARAEPRPLKRIETPGLIHTPAKPEIGEILPRQEPPGERQNRRGFFFFQIQTVDPVEDRIHRILAYPELDGGGQLRGIKEPVG